jgi:hypothetical protein
MCELLTPTLSMEFFWPSLDHIDHVKSACAWDLVLVMDVTEWTII